MRQTLFFIPHEFLGVPLLGLLSWASLGLLLVVVVLIASAKNRLARTELIQQNMIIWGIMLAAIAFVLPRIETRIDDGSESGWPVGLPIRGYGMMMMLGVLSGVAVALKRSEARGISREAFFSLATWSILSGIIGARLFYVIQHWEDLPGSSFRERFWAIFQVTEGGLVVYGSVIGGLISILVWTYRYRYSVFKVADAVTPAFFLGLAFGRMGCLLNGCCYGGICEQDLPSIAFPKGSIVYDEQLSSGRLLGIEQSDGLIRSVAGSSWAASKGIEPGQSLQWLDRRMVRGATKEEPLRAPDLEAILAVNGKKLIAHPEDMPARSLRVHPSQVYAAIGGLILFLWTASLSPFLKRDSLVFATGLVFYGLVRIAEEIIRVDEAGQFGTTLSIAQWISIIGIAGGIVLWLRVWILSRTTEKRPVNVTS